MITVSMPGYNREKTIYRALESVKNQKFKDFEIIIYDNCSTDLSILEIERFIKDNPELDIIFIKGKKFLPNCEDWNEPLKHAKGEFIAVLEGDDQFLPNHLSTAHKIFIQNPCVGIWTDIGVIKERYIDFSLIYDVKLVPPPSQAIFRNKGLMYNIKDYIYAPEIDLYIRLMLKYAYKIYNNEFRTTIRDESPKDYRFPYKIIRDRFTIQKEYKEHSNIKARIKNCLVKHLWIVIWVLNTTRKYGLKYGINILKEHYKYWCNIKRTK